MRTDKLLVSVAIVVGIILILVASSTGRSRRVAAVVLPGPPGGSDHHHVKHGIAAFLLDSPASRSPGSAAARSGPPGVILGALITYPQAIIMGLLQGVASCFRSRASATA